MALMQSEMLELGTPLPEFSLPDTVSGHTFRSSDFANGPLVVAIICNHCPFVKHIKPGIAELGRYCRQHGVGMVAVSSNDAVSHPNDGPAPMKEDAARFGYGFPYLYDESQDVARAFRAVCTPEFYLFDGEHRLVYRGQMDDARPNGPEPNDGKDIKAAIEAVIEGRSPSGDQKPSIGCSIKWKE